MEKIFETANEQHLKAVVVYANEDDAILYFEPEFANKVSKEDCENLFNKGLLVIHDGPNAWRVRPNVMDLSSDYVMFSVGDTTYHSDGYTG